MNTTATIEYIILIIAVFAANNKISEVEAYQYLRRWGAIDFCERHYGIMHTLSVEDNVASLQQYCARKGGTL